MVSVCIPNLFCYRVAGQPVGIFRYQAWLIVSPSGIFWHLLRYIWFYHTSFTIGFAADIIGPAMGPQTISFGLFGTALAYLHRVIAVRKMPYQAIGIFIIGFLTGALTLFLNSFKNQSVSSGIYTVLFWIPLYSAVIGPFLFLPSAWWMRIKTHRFSKH